MEGGPLENPKLKIVKNPEGRSPPLSPGETSWQLFTKTKRESLNGGSRGAAPGENLCF